MPKILHLITWFNPGGIETWLLSVLDLVHRQNDRYHMDVLCKGSEVGKLAPLAIASGATVHHCPLTATHVPFARQFRQILEEGQYDLIHNHFGPYSGLPTWIARQMGIPVITSFHNTSMATHTGLNRPVLKQMRDLYSTVSLGYAFQHSDLITGCSQAVLKSLVPSSVSPEKQRALYYGVKIPPIPGEDERRALRRELDLPEDTPIVIHVGSFKEQKNHMGLIRIFGMVVSRVPEAKLLLLGDGLLRPAVEQKVAEMDLQNSVRFLGIRQDATALMGKSDLFLFPSFHEGLPVVALEAGVSGLPIVGSDIPGTDEATEPGETAFLHPVSDEDAMADSAVRILTDKSLAERMGRAARERASALFSIDVSVRNLLQLYDECLMNSVETPR